MDNKENAESWRRTIFDGPAQSFGGRPEETSNKYSSCLGMPQSRRRSVILERNRPSHMP